MQRTWACHIESRICFFFLFSPFLLRVSFCLSMKSSFPRTSKLHVRSLITAWYFFPTNRTLYYPLILEHLFEPQIQAWEHLEFGEATLGCLIQADDVRVASRHEPKWPLSYRPSNKYIPEGKLLASDPSWPSRRKHSEIEVTDNARYRSLSL